MSRVHALADHLAPDSISLLERSAQQRVSDATCLSTDGRTLIAVYLLGYAVEMCLAAAFFRSDGFAPNTPIDRETRKRRMAQARQIQAEDGVPLMSSDPHPLIGWARYLQWKRRLSETLSQPELERLREAVRRAQIVYRHWRPELRYKSTHVRVAQLTEVRLAAEWFIQNLGRI